MEYCVKKHMKLPLDMHPFNYFKKELDWAIKKIKSVFEEVEKKLPKTK